MKRKIVAALSIYSLIFLLGGIYIIVTTEKATSTLDRLIMLHQVEILREHLLIHIKTVQADLFTKNTRYAKSSGTVIDNVINMESISHACFGCHHSPSVQERLSGLDKVIESYKNFISRVLTIRANRDRLQEEEEKAFLIAEELQKEVNTMVHIATTRLSNETQASLKDIFQTKIILYLLVVLTPFFAAGLGFIFIRELTSPVKLLLEATRRIKGGNLDYRIKGLKDEFGELADSFNDMSDWLKQHMLKIQESERRYRTLFESAGDAILILNTDNGRRGKIVDANLAAAEMHGYAVEELLALNIKDLGPLDTVEEGNSLFQRILEDEWINAEITHRRKDHSQFPIEISAGLVGHGNHKQILVFGRDISSRKKMEELILQAKHDWEDTFNAITDMITIHDRDFTIVRANKAAETLLNLPTLEIPKAKCYEYYHGKTCPPKYCPTCETMKCEKTISFELWEPHLSMFLDVRAMPRFNKDGEMIGVIHVVRDITERKQIEETLQRAEQMKMAGEWATGLAHEIKNPLAGIKVSVEVLARELDLSENDKVVVSRVIDEIRRIEQLIKSLLNFAKPPKPHFTRINMNDLLDKMITFSPKHPYVLSSWGSMIDVVKDFDRDLPEVMADPTQMQQVFLNLFFNAVEAMSDGGALHVQTGYNAAIHAVEIDISDTGPGIKEEVLKKMFQPFFTTKVKGSGLGLAITKRLIEQHGGKICAENRKQGGAVFHVVLPIEQAEEELIP